MSKLLQSDRRKHLANLVADQRKAKGMTQAELARALGRHQPFIANIESGERRLDIVELIEICDVLGADLNEIIAELRT